MKAFRTIRGRMIICYGGIILMTILIMSAIYYRQASAILEDRASESLLQLAATSSANLDASIENMDGIASQVVSSQLIKDTFYTETATTAEYLRNRKELFSLLFTVAGPRIDSQIHLFSTKGKFVEFGRAFDLTYQARRPLEVCPWMAGCLEQEGRLFLVSPRRCEWDQSDHIVFSVCRAFNSTLGAPYDAVAEVQMDYEDLSQMMGQSVLSDTIGVFIYDAYGQCIYPLGEALEDWDPRNAGSGVLPLGEGRSAKMAACHTSQYSGLTVIVTEHLSDLLAPVRVFRGKLLLIGAILLALTSTTTLILSSQLTEPIRKIQKSINDLQLADLHTSEQYPAASYELDNLGRSYIKMVERLQHSLEEVVSARSYATEARMLALQSQMSPHFLYNTITIISIKAEDNEDYEVVAMCECLTGMLRYATRDTAVNVPLRLELDYLDQYLYLMHCRYPNRFTADILVPDEMGDLVIPRLVLQPLVENSFKHGLQQSGPWQISLTGGMADDVWHLTVADNGVGFPQETLDELNARFAASTGDFQEIKADHIGLANIFERLRFRYRDRAVFQIENLPDGGCQVTIGGVRAFGPEGGIHHAID